MTSIKGHIAKLAPQRLIDKKLRNAFIAARDQKFRDHIHEEIAHAAGESNTLTLRLLWNDGGITEYYFMLWEDTPYYVDKFEKNPTAILSMDEDTVLLIYDKQLTPIGAWRHAHYDNNAFFRGATVDADDGRSVYHIMVLGKIFEDLRSMMGV